MAQQYEDPQKAPDSSSYKSAYNKASQYAKNPQKLDSLLTEASDKADKQQGALKEVWGSLTIMFRLLGAYRRGEYRDIPWQSIFMLIAAIVYFVMPIDLIPDAIIVIGYLDDVAVIGWTIRMLKSDIDNFLEWEKYR
jgi:uncharacterized membrane protein YkvA (DUF1232 family)